MPYNRFICPDKETCDIKQCLEKGCRIPWAFEAERCLSKPTLVAISQQRDWTGVPSTTQLLNGTRENVLRICKDYAINPQDMMWAIFGTGVHSAVEAHTGEDGLAEERIFDDYSSGSFDYFEPEPGYLYDRKTYGSYKTAKVLGLYKERIPILDKNGVQEKYKNGKPKFNDRWKVGHKSRLDLAIQLNDYRRKLESKGHTVNKMFCEILTRDAGTYIAEQRGIFTNAQLVLINRISDTWIDLYMKTKSERLTQALDIFQKTGELPPPCTYRETWGGLKCKRYCGVWEYCEVGRKAHGEDGSEFFGD